MELTSRIENENYIVSLKGDFSQESVTQFRKDIQPYLEDATTHAIIVNMQEVTYIDSSGLGMITFLHKKLIKGGAALRPKKFVLCDLNLRINEVFQMSGLYNILKIYSTEEEALKALE